MKPGIDSTAQSCSTRYEPKLRLSRGIVLLLYFDSKDLVTSARRALPSATTYETTIPVRRITP